MFTLMIYWTHLHTLNACEWTDLKYYWVSTKSILPPYGEGWGTNSTSFRNSSSRIHWAQDRHLVVSTYGCEATLLVHLTLRLGIGPCATCRKFALILVVERGIAYEPLNSNEGRWRQNFIDLKCSEMKVHNFADCSWFVLLWRQGNEWVDGHNISIVGAVAGEMDGRRLKPLGDFCYTLIGLSLCVGDGSYIVATHYWGRLCNPRVT